MQQRYNVFSVVCCSALSPETLFGLIFWPSRCQTELINGIFFGQFNSRKLNYQSVIDYYPAETCQTQHFTLFTLQTKLTNTRKGHRPPLAFTMKDCQFFVDIIWRNLSDVWLYFWFIHLEKEINGGGQFFPQLDLINLCHICQSSYCLASLHSSFKLGKNPNNVSPTGRQDHNGKME